jgi:ABC-type amino acid transport substrate-binding protein
MARVALTVLALLLASHGCATVEAQKDQGGNGGRAPPQETGARGGSRPEEGKVEPEHEAETTTTADGMQPTTTDASTPTVYTFAQDVDYPPYAYKDETTGELRGFGKDFADGMTALCPNITINVVQASWTDCWNGSSASIGQGLNNGTYDACMTYTHTHSRGAQ